MSDRVHFFQAWMTRDLISSAYFIVTPTLDPNAIDLEEDKLMLLPETMSV